MSKDEIRNAALEEAAKVVEAETFTGSEAERTACLAKADRTKPLTVMHATLKTTKENIAAKIRSLKSKEKAKLS